MGVFRMVEQDPAYITGRRVGLLSVITCLFDTFIESRSSREVNMIQLIRRIGWALDQTGFLLRQ
jgi:hypothetical protein